MWTYSGSDQWLVLALRGTVENLFSGRVSGKGQGCKGIHDEVDPEELNGLEDRFHVGVIDGRDKGQEDSRDVDGDLELSPLVRVP